MVSRETERNADLERPLILRNIDFPFRSRVAFRQKYEQTHLHRRQFPYLGFKRCGGKRSGLQVCSFMLD